MDATSYIRKQFAAVHRVEDGVVADLTDELIGWTPPGTANPIAATLIHALNAEDGFIQRRLQDKQGIWTAGGWGTKIGLKTIPGKGEGWEEASRGSYSIASILAYRDEVRSATNSYLETLAADDLERPVDFAGGQWPVADVLALLAEHTAHHIGEIAALKGVQGVQGMPF